MVSFLEPLFFVNHRITRALESCREGWGGNEGEIFPLQRKKRQLAGLSFLFHMQPRAVKSNGYWQGK